MNKRAIKLFSLIFAAVMVIQTPIAVFAATSSSPYISGTYTHQSRFDGFERLDGIDVSSHNGDINWSKVKADGVDFAMIRVGARGYGSSGSYIYDEQFTDNIEGAQKVGIDVGVYFYSQAISTSEAQDEAEYVLSRISKYDLDLPVAYDIEFAGGSGTTGRLYNAKLSKSEQTKIATTFCAAVEKAGFESMVYANKSFLEDNLNASTLEQNSIPVWLANYTSNTKYSGSFSMWQYTASGSVNGIGGDVDCNFMYVDASSEKFEVSKISSQVYTGSKIKPSVSVYCDGEKLSEGEDYTLSYSDNKNIGTAALTVKGAGDYKNTASKTAHFSIVPGKTSGLEFVSRTATSVTFKWNKVTGAEGYKLYMYKDNKWQAVAKTTSNSVTVNDMPAAHEYKFKVRAYKKVNSVNYFGSYSASVYGSTNPYKVKSLSVKSYALSSVTVQWKKQHASFYRVYVYNSSKKKYEKYCDVNTNYAKISNLKSASKIQVKVKAFYKLSDGSYAKGVSSNSLNAYTRSKSSTLEQLKSSSSKKITARWSKSEKADGYQIMWSTSKDFSSNKKSVYVKGGSTKSATLTTSKSKQKYYVRVRSYRVCDGKKIYSYWSDALSVKTK